MLRTLVLLLLVACGAAPPTVRPAATAPTLPDLPLATGGTWSYTSGKILVIDIWASWCKPCKKGLKRTARLAATHPDIAVLGLSVDEDDAAMQAFIRDAGVTFVNARVPVETVQAAPLSVTSLPAVVVVDRAGRIRWTDDDMQDSDYDRIETVLAQLRRE